MKRFCFFVAMMVGVMVCAGNLRALDQAMPQQADPHAAISQAQQDEVANQRAAALYAGQNRAAFERDIHLGDFRLLGIEHEDQVKIVDSWARQTLRQIRHRDSIDGQDPVYTALDMAFRPEAWDNRNIIYVQSVPIREELGAFAANDVEARRIREEALVSPNFLLRDDVQNRLAVLGQNSTQEQAVGQVEEAFQAFHEIGRTLALVPPPTDSPRAPWVNPDDILGALLQSFPPPAPGASGATTAAAAMTPRVPDTMPYTLDQQKNIAAAFESLATAWTENDAAAANKEGIEPLVAALPAIDPAVYPTHTRAVVELWYNRSFSGTLVAFIYFAAMVLFFLVAVGIAPRTGKIEKTAIGFYGLALACHITAMGVRWWIDGRIPIQNEFESVMGSACTGCTIGYLLELWKRNGIFGTAFAFVGFLATTALLTTPYVFGKDLGSAPAKVAGILNTYWLYIHVNIVIASYALIGASFAMALTFLLLRLTHWISPIEPGFTDGQGEHDGPSPASGPGNVKQVQAAVVTTQPSLTQDQRLVLTKRTALMDTLDQANMVVLQMAFWFLGIGIICGAVWADQSWGRPWGWDPKETFALVTWMVYLVIVHVRLVIKQKADMTAWLSVAGFAVMMFNWIGVNFFLKGLHSYA